MSSLGDIPERDNQTGQDQLTSLRSYLKDVESISYKYPDTLLISLLVKDHKYIVWRKLVGAPEDIKPWSFDYDLLQKPLNRLRLEIGDTEEATLTYTDWDLLKYLDVYPLRYVAYLISLKDTSGITYPTGDLYNPIYLVRTFLDDKEGEKYTDQEIANKLLDSGLNPYSFVAENLRVNTGSTISSGSGDSQLASLDGISFSTKTLSEQVLDEKLSQDALEALSLNSVYSKGSDSFGFWMSGENLAKVDWEVDWYAL